ncbi:hypothetical protein pb186bvf_008136 [Paramecium bursaria]
MFLFVILGRVIADDYVHIFAQEWPGSVCRAEKCSQEYMLNYDGLRWNIHGLWPNLVKPTYCQQIQECRQEEFNPELISAKTQKEIDVAWVGLYSDTYTFRKHEWEKHGTCYVGAFDQDTYFDIVYQLSDYYNFYTILAEAGILPDEERYLTDAILKQAFARFPKAEIHYSCEKVNDKFLLGQLKLCFDDDLELRSCKCQTPTANPLVSCGNVFYYPPL